MYDDMLIPTGGSDGVQVAIDERLVLADYTAEPSTHSTSSITVTTA